MKKVFAALIDHRNNEKKEKAKIGRVTQIVRKFILYHSWRRYAKNITYVTALKDKSKIDGAYLLIKRFKNRLKSIDDVMRRINIEKANHADFEQLKASMAINRAKAVFDDMSKLMECTVVKFD